MYDLLKVISKMSLQDSCLHVLPEFGLRWKDVSRKVRDARLPMTPVSVALVLHEYATKFLTVEEVIHIIARLKLKYRALKPRRWHVINLMEQIVDEPGNVLIQQVSSRVKQALKNSAYRNKKPQVNVIELGNVIFMCVEIVVNNLENTLPCVVNVVCQLGEPVALVSTLHSPLLEACVQGLGYGEYEDAGLDGKDIASLLEIAINGINPAPRQGTIPVTTHRLNKKMKVTLQVKADNTLETLKQWGVLSPESKL